MLSIMYCLNTKSNFILLPNSKNTFNFLDKTLTNIFSIKFNYRLLLNCYIKSILTCNFCITGIIK